MKYSKKQIALGLRVEMEHWKTVHKNKKTIRKIVFDHLREDPDYYTKLKTLNL